MCGGGWRGQSWGSVLNEERNPLKMDGRPLNFSGGGHAEGSKTEATRRDQKQNIYMFRIHGLKTNLPFQPDQGASVSNRAESAIFFSTSKFDL